MRSTVLSFLLLSLWGGAAALAAWVVCRLLRRAHAPSRFLCWLWLAVGLRFVLPFGIPLALPRPQNTQLAEAADTVQALTQPELTAPDLPAMVPASPAAPAPWYTTLTVWHLLAAVWAVGVALLAVRAAWGYLRLSRQVALACKTPDGCFSGPCVPAPFTLGLLRPRIYLPSGLDGSARGRRHLARAHPHPPGRPADQAAVFTPWPACTGSTRWRGWPSGSLSATWRPPATKLPCEVNLPPPAAPTARAFCGLLCRGAACPAAWPLVRAALRPASCICCITAAWGPGPWWSAPWSSLPA